MTPPRHIPRTTWSTLIDTLYEDSWNPRIGRFRSRFVYRGAGSSTSTLSSSLVRLAGRDGDTARLELALVRNFRKYAHHAAAPSDSIWSWLALGQHCGLPTRLLDWTYSPLVALHFATHDTAEFDRDGMIWCVAFVAADRLLPRRLRELLKADMSDTITVDMLAGFPTLQSFDRLARTPFVIFMEPPALDRRILHQHALFSLMSSPMARLDDWLRTHPSLVRRVLVPARAKWEIRDKLDQANINERVLFPDLEGLCRWLARYYTPPPEATSARDGRPLRPLATPRPKASRG